MKAAIWELRYFIILLIGVVIYAVFEWQRFKVGAYALMLQAKRMAKDAVLQSGNQQVEWIIKRAYQYLPVTLTMFISEQLMIKIIEKLYSKAKDYIDDGQLNNSIK